VPAAAVIPAPIAYINFVAVKKLVVGSRRAGGGPLFDATAPLVRVFSAEFPGCSSPSVPGGRQVYFEKIRVLQAGSTRLNICAWNNGIGRRSYFVGFRDST
jgi:hypothetical protein